MAGRRVLILGGTTEALEVAEKLAVVDGVEVITSMAGVTRNPRLPRGEIRTGGFGGADGLLDYLRAGNIAAVLDATHPFAAQISRHAADAGGRAGVPVLHLSRPPWEQGFGDNWHRFNSAREAAAWLDGSPLPDASTVFLTIGRTELAVFAEITRLDFIARAIEAPDLAGAAAVVRTILGRGPFSLEDERRLLVENDVACLVAKNSGGTASYPKMEAARDLGLPVGMITPPPPPAGMTAEDTDTAIEWLCATLDVAP
jgi:precorrin-6A/cobalt-precorrin-6A reductase